MAKNASNVVEGTDSDWTTVVEPYPPTFKFENEGDTLTGTYLKKREVEQPDLNAEPGVNRLANVYEILSDADNSKYSVWGNFSIDKAFESIVEGQTVRISYFGKVALDGGRTVNQMKVQVKN